MVLEDYYRRIDSDEPTSAVELFAEDARCFMMMDGVVARAESKAEWARLIQTRPPERKDHRHIPLAWFHGPDQESVIGVVTSPAGVLGSFMAHALVDGSMIKSYSMQFTSETELFPPTLAAASDQV